MNEIPLFLHDCDQCKFLGIYEGKDLYFCNNDIDRKTLVSRRSSEPSDYISGFINTEELIEAIKRAKKLNLLGDYDIILKLGWNYGRELLELVKI